MHFLDFFGYYVVGRIREQGHDDGGGGFREFIVLNLLLNDLSQCYNLTSAALPGHYLRVEHAVERGLPTRKHSQHDIRPFAPVGLQSGFDSIPNTNAHVADEKRENMTLYRDTLVCDGHLVSGGRASLKRYSTFNLEIQFPYADPSSPLACVRHNRSLEDQLCAPPNLVKKTA